MFGLLRWFFTPVRLYGGDGGEDSTSSDSRYDYGGGKLETPSEAAQREYEQAVTDIMGGSFTYNEIVGIEPSYSTTDADFNADWSSALADFKALDAEYTANDRTDDDLGDWTNFDDQFTQDLPGGGVIDFDESGGFQVFGPDGSTFTDQDRYSKNGVFSGSDITWGSTSIEVSTQDSILGYSYASKQSYYTNGDKMGFLASSYESLTNFFDGWDFNEKTARTLDAIGDVIGTAVSAVLTILQVQSLATFVTSGYQGMIAARNAGFLTHTEFYTLTAIQAFSAYMLGSRIAGLQDKSMTMSQFLDIDYFFRSNSEALKYSNNETLAQIAGDYSQRLKTEQTIENMEKDGSAYFAGGDMYNAQFAGNALYVANNPRNNAGIAAHELGINYYDKQFLMQEKSVYQDFQPIKTDPAPDDELGKAGQLGQVNVLLGQYETLVEEYNVGVAAINSTIEEFNATAATDIERRAALKTSIESQKSALGTSSGKLTELSEAITGLRKQFNL